MPFRLTERANTPRILWKSRRRPGQRRVLRLLGRVAGAPGRRPCFLGGTVTIIHQGQELREGVPLLAGPNGFERGRSRATARHVRRIPLGDRPSCVPGLCLRRSNASRQQRGQEKERETDTTVCRIAHGLPRVRPRWQQRATAHPTIPPPCSERKSSAGNRVFARRYPRHHASPSRGRAASASIGWGRIAASASKRLPARRQKAGRMQCSATTFAVLVVLEQEAAGLVGQHRDVGLDTWLQRPDRRPPCRASRRSCW